MECGSLTSHTSNQKRLLTMELSAVIITYNAARHLRACIDALRSVADEIIIVDSGSTDSTAEIARGFPEVRWYERTFDGYGSQKNYANSLAQGKYILSVDADEVLSPELQRAILAEKGQWRADAYSFLRVAVYCGAFIRAAGWYPDWKVRIFRRDAARWSDEPVHERLLLPSGTKVIRLQGEMWHYSYASPEENLLRTSKYARLAAEMMAKAGKSPNWWRGFAKAGARFTKSLIIKGGWRLGWRGVSIAFLGAIYYVLREIYLSYAHYRETAPNGVSSFHDPSSSPSKSLGMGAADTRAPHGS
ncbi:MAG: glycosyltransferase family 2 protein [Bacteroidia bacterium]|nr:glycosyltransferase family 2 protein [Bacteroidia bacterium]